MHFGIRFVVCMCVPPSPSLPRLSLSLSSISLFDETVVDVIVVPVVVLLVVIVIDVGTNMFLPSLFDSIQTWNGVYCNSVTCV